MPVAVGMLAIVMLGLFSEAGIGMGGTLAATGSLQTLLSEAAIDC